MKALKKKKQRIRGKKTQWIQRREEKKFYRNIVEELRVEDTKTYEEMLRMNYDKFKFILKDIEQDITPIALMSGGLTAVKLQSLPVNPRRLIKFVCSLTTFSLFDFTYLSS